MNNFFVVFGPGSTSPLPAAMNGFFKRRPFAANVSVFNGLPLYGEYDFSRTFHSAADEIPVIGRICLTPAV